MNVLHVGIMDGMEDKNTTMNLVSSDIKFKPDDFGHMFIVIKVKNGDEIKIKQEILEGYKLLGLVDHKIWWLNTWAGTETENGELHKQLNELRRKSKHNENSII